LETSVAIDDERKIGCSIGITTSVAFLSVHELDDMIKVADESLYNVKAAGKGTYIFA
jgi:GGDEF domain-containing protein